MAKTSVHIEPVKSNSEEHNRREKDLDYNRKELTSQNESFELCSIAERLEHKKKCYTQATGQKMQAKATPIREGVVVIKSDTTMAQLKNFAARCKEQFGIEAIQIHIHKDEGHWDKDNQWSPNLHAHMVFDWTGENGKSVKMNRESVAEMQSILAECLEMERGKSSSKKHLNSIQQKVEAQKEQIKTLQRDKEALEAKVKDLSKLHSEKETTLRELSEQKNRLESEVQNYSKLKAAKDLTMGLVSSLGKKGEIKGLNAQISILTQQVTHLTVENEKFKREADYALKSYEKIKGKYNPDQLKYDVEQARCKGINEAVRHINFFLVQKGYPTIDYRGYDNSPKISFNNDNLQHRRGNTM